MQRRHEMAKTIRKGARVRYIGATNLLMIGKIYEVHRKSYSEIEVSAPVKCIDGQIHTSRCFMYIGDFELVEA